MLGYIAQDQNDAKTMRDEIMRRFDVVTEAVIQLRVELGKHQALQEANDRSELAPGLRIPRGNLNGR